MLKATGMVRKVDELGRVVIPTPVLFPSLGDHRPYSGGVGLNEQN
jgi:hypothetical protein